MELNVKRKKKRRRRRKLLSLQFLGVCLKEFENGKKKTYFFICLAVTIKFGCNWQNGAVICILYFM